MRKAKARFFLRGRKWFWMLSAAGVLSSAWVLSSMIKSRYPNDIDKVQWISIAESEKEYLKKEKPVLYEFSADWCGYCQAMKREVFADPDTADWINRHFIPVKVVNRSREDGKDRPEVQELQQKYQISGIPALVVRLPNGSFTTNVGYTGMEAVRKYLKEQSEEFNRQIQAKI